MTNLEVHYGNGIIGPSKADVEWANQFNNELAKEDIDVIFIAGGNTFYLLEKVVESGFFELVKELVGKGVIYRV